MVHPQAWCFLVSRNQYLDYRTVVAPDFICQAGIGNILARVTEGGVTELGTGFYREILYSKAGDFTIVYRIIDATAENTGIAGNGTLKDAVGREISLIEGLVFQGFLTDLIVTEHHLEAAHQRVISYYQEFWEAITRISIFPSESFIIEDSQSSEQSLKLTKLSDYIAGERPQVCLPKQENLEPNYSSLQYKYHYLLKGEVSSLVVFPKSDMIAVRYDHHIRVLKIREEESADEEEPVYRFSGTKTHLGGFTTPIVTDPSGELIATAMIEGFDENQIKLLNIKNNTVKTLGTHGITNLTRVKAVAFSPDSKIVLSASGRKIKLWDTECEGIELGKLSGHSSEVRCLGVDPKNGLLASGDAHGNINLWKISTKEIVKTFSAHEYSVNSLAFSPDGKFLASGSDDGTIKVWNVTTEEEYPVDWKQSQPINSVAFSPNGSFIATGSDDTLIKIWDLKNRDLSPICLGRHEKAVTCVVFTPDGKTLVSSSKDCTVRIWQPVE